MCGTILTCALRSYSYLLAVYSKHLSYLAPSNNYSYYSYLLALAIAAIDVLVSNYYSHCKNFIILIFVGCYPQQKLFTDEISAP